MIHNDLISITNYIVKSKKNVFQITIPFLSKMLTIMFSYRGCIEITKWMHKGTVDIWDECVHEKHRDYDDGFISTFVLCALKMLWSHQK